MVGNPARQKGWMSSHGEALKNPDAQGVMVCPESGFRYQIETELPSAELPEKRSSRLRCLDLNEEDPLPEHLATGHAGYRSFKV